MSRPTVRLYSIITLKVMVIRKLQLLEEDNTYINRQPYQVRNIIINPNYCGRVNNQYGQFDNMFLLLFPQVYMSKRRDFDCKTNQTDTFG